MSGGRSTLNQPAPVQRSASFNATSTVPLKITILDESSPGTRREMTSSYCVKNSKSLSNCSLISKIVSGKGGDGTRNIISHLVSSGAASSMPIDAGGGIPEKRRKDVAQFIPKVPTNSSDGVDKFRDYYV